jgi:hypothetical protein
MILYPVGAFLIFEHPKDLLLFLNDVDIIYTVKYINFKLTSS